MTITTLAGEELSISEMTDTQLLRERDWWNHQLERMFHETSGKYDAAATILKEIEGEINRREHEGPPWTAD